MRAEATMERPKGISVYLWSEIAVRLLLGKGRNHHTSIFAGSSNVLILLTKRHKRLQDDPQESRDSDIETAMQENHPFTKQFHC